MLHSKLMRYSKLFGKTSRDFPKDEVSTNAKFLLKAGFIDKLMAGSYTLLPLGFRVLKKIEGIIREELNATGAQELLMPLMHPKSIWNETQRWDSAKEVMYQFEKDGKEYALSFTHEEIVMDLIRKKAKGPKDFPIKVYHFSTKFRDEPRAKSGILRGREFLMNDLYSAHTSKEDMLLYYEKVKEAYFKIFERIGLKVRLVEAAGGVFTKENTHEFQVFAEEGEDTIFYCDNCAFAQNKEIANVKEGDTCPSCKKEKIKVTKSIEVGNIFPLGTSYAEKMNVSVEGSPVWLASYGIGPTRVIGTIVETSHDDKGIIWPKSVAPYNAHLIYIGESTDTKKKAEEFYEALEKKGVEVLFDDREEQSAGEKFKDADLIGIPIRLLISDKTKETVEWKERASERAELLSVTEVIKRLSS
jgi:prolyl-tRNA synthetase